MNFTCHLTTCCSLARRWQWFALQADGEIHSPDIFCWEHETDARSRYASGLEDIS